MKSLKTESTFLFFKVHHILCSCILLKVNTFLFGVASFSVLNSSIKLKPPNYVFYTDICLALLSYDYFSVLTLVFLKLPITAVF